MYSNSNINHHSFKEKTNITSDFDWSHFWPSSDLKLKGKVGSTVKTWNELSSGWTACLRLEWKSKNCKLHESIAKELCAHKISLVLLQRINGLRYAFIYITNINNVTKPKQYWSNRKKRFIANLFAIITKPFALKSFT